MHRTLKIVDIEALSDGARAIAVGYLGKYISTIMHVLDLACTSLLDNV
jgi:hypothetical protein